MIRIEYQVQTDRGDWRNKVVFADDYEEANALCELCDKFDYQIVDISNYTEEV